QSRRFLFAAMAFDAVAGDHLLDSRALGRSRKTERMLRYGEAGHHAGEKNRGRAAGCVAADAHETDSARCIRFENRKPSIVAARHRLNQLRARIFMAPVGLNTMP